MKLLRRNWKAVANVFALVFSIWFLLDPGPWPMAAFVFVAQPLFLAVLVGYLAGVWKDLRRQRVL
jgi:hypothetical protein